MAVPAEIPFKSPEDYLDWERSQMEKHEYVAGEVFAMSALRGGMSPLRSIYRLRLMKPWLASPAASTQPT